MSMDGPHQILHRSFKLHSGDRFGDQLRGLRPNDMHSQDLAVVRIGDDLDESLMLADDRGSRVGRKRELTNLHVVPGFPGAGFRNADAADLWVAICRSWVMFGIDALAR